MLGASGAVGFGSYFTKRRLGRVRVRVMGMVIAVATATATALVPLEADERVGCVDVCQAVEMANHQWSKAGR